MRRDAPLLTPLPLAVLVPLLATALGAPASAQLQPPVPPPENPLTPEKAVLGKILFWDEQLSSDDTMACGTCHIPGTGGADPRAGERRHPGFDGVFWTDDDVFSSPGLARADRGGHYVPDPAFGFEPRLTPRVAPSVVGAAHFSELFWDGRAGATFVDPETGDVSIPAGGALETQAVAPILNEVEMAYPERTWGDVRDKLRRVRPLKLASSLPADVATAIGLHPTYSDLFAAAFGDPGITAERIAFAIASYERTLVPNQTPWDAFAAGDNDALAPLVENGMGVFTGPGRCDECHVPPLFSDGSYRALGVRPPAEDPGRQAITGDFSDRGKFKVPSLRNVVLREVYFHDGRRDQLAEVTSFYNAGGGFPDNKDPLITPLGISPNSLFNLGQFLTIGLTDPRVANELPPFDRPTLYSERPQPNPRLIGTATAGSGGIAPVMIARTPPKLGSRSFKLGVASGLGGAPAMLVVEVVSTPAPGAPAGTAVGAGGGTPFAGPAQAATMAGREELVRRVVQLAGEGAGAGWATLFLELPAAPGLAGSVLQATWLVRDPAAPGGFARTRTAELELF